MEFHIGGTYQRWMPELVGQFTTDGPPLSNLSPGLVEMGSVIRQRADAGGQIRRMIFADERGSGTAASVSATDRLADPSPRAPYHKNCFRRILDFSRCGFAAGAVMRQAARGLCLSSARFSGFDLYD